RSTSDPSIPMYPHSQNYGGSSREPQRPSLARYLLGQGPMPPPTNQELAVAAMNQQLDTSTPEPSPLMLDIHIPNPDSNSADTYQLPPKNLRININTVEPGDFVDRIRANVITKERPDASLLGWKSSDAPKRALPNRLTVDDVKTVFDHFRPLLLSTRRQKPVFMEVFNLPGPEPNEQPAVKTSETTVTNELRIVKECLACKKHAGNNRFCFVRRDEEHAGEHVPLGLEEVTLWARKMHDGEADRDCINPPAVLNLDNLAKNAEDRAERSAKRKGGLPQNNVHVDVHLGTLGDILNGKASGNKRSRSCSPDSVHPLDDSDSDSDTEAASIDEVIACLHKKMPALDYAQYQPALRRQGIVYAKLVADFDRQFFANDIGMAQGAVGEFIRTAKSIVTKGKGRAVKKVRIDYTEKENNTINV
ncbi:hypothetical protein EV361DRAFT_805826, partial [Lentinula raphanica]